MTYRLVDAFWHAAHLVFMGFSAFAWLVPELRPWHLGVQASVAASWFLLGSRKGWGYCWLTDRQWAYKERHGKRPTTESFVEHWTNDILGMKLRSSWIQGAILWIWIATTLLSLALSIIPLAIP